MAVAPSERRLGLFRALLTAHVQMMINRSRKGLGRRGTIGLAIVIAILLAGATPLFTTYGYLGWVFGHALKQPLLPSLMGGILFATAVGFGLMGGLLGGARQLTWEAYRSFPVPFRTLFFAETIAGLGDLVVLSFVGICLALGGAFAWRSPWAIPQLVFLLGQLVLWVLFVQHLVGSLAVGSVRRLRRALMLLVVAAWAGMSLVAAAARELRDDLLGDRLERFEYLWEHARPVIEIFPTSLSVRSLIAAHRLDLGRALYLELPMLAVTLVLGASSYALLQRENRATNRAPNASAAQDRTFRGRTSPLWMMTRLHFRHVAGSLQGRFGLVVPLITVVVVRGPVASAGVTTALTLPGAVIYLALASAQFHFNQFGLDGHGVKTLFLLPVTTRDLLVGKLLALLAYSGLQNLLLFLLLGMSLEPSLSDVAAASVLALILGVTQVLEGHWISAIFPRPLAMQRMNSTGLSGAALLPLGAGMVNGAVFGGLYGLLSVRAPHERILILVALLGVIIAFYVRLLPAAARFVTGHREKLVEVLG